ncbi:hypothetical protein DQ812_23885, partial [Salmonella enterica subsp. enterica]|nr:hypothetical protein [Salmonella enterica subsp. enterica serovar Goverdhan]
KCAGSFWADAVLCAKKTPQIHNSDRHYCTDLIDGGLHFLIQKFIVIFTVRKTVIPFGCYVGR